MSIKHEVGYDLILEEHGLADTDECIAAYDYWKKKSKKHNSRSLKGFSLTPRDILTLLREANITGHQVGRYRGQYVLCRYKDIGGYHMGNCRFMPKSDNGREQTYCNLLIRDKVDVESMPLEEYIKGFNEWKSQFK